VVTDLQHQANNLLEEQLLSHGNTYGMALYVFSWDKSFSSTKVRKNEGGINNGQSRDTGNTQDENKQTITQRSKKMSNTDPIKNWGWTQVLAKCKQLLLLIRHQPNYSFNQSSTLKVLAGKRKVSAFFKLSKRRT
jgi:hypothetical protein